MKKRITKCPKCGSSCLMYKSDGTILCAVCMIKMNKAGDIFSSNDFEGEPDMPIKEKFEINKKEELL